MTVKEAIIQGLRAWLATANGFDADQSQARLRPADADGPRNALPYISVGLLSRVQVGGLEHLADITPIALTPRLRYRAHYRATASVQGYGSGADDWLETARLGVESDDVAEAVTTAIGSGGGLTIYPGPVQDLSGPFGPGFEERASMDVELHYTLDSATAAGVELLTAAIDTDLEVAGHDDLTDTITVTLGA